MEKTDKRYQAYIDILREELIPAMGCTEPIAVAYAAAAARNTLGELPDKVLVEASGSMIKNVKSVIVPNTDNMKGLEAAAAAGIVAGKQEKKLEVIADVTPEQTKAIRAYLDQTDIKVRHVENGVTFDIILTVWKGEHSAQVRIAVFHTNIVHVEKDGEVLVDIPVHGDSEETLTDRSLLEMAQVFRVPFPRVLRSIYVPQVLPYFRAAADTALGLSWKAGTAAEVIGLCSGTIGERLYTAKVYFQTADLFAWTAVIVLLSVLFEGLFLRGVDALTERWCA